jgi:hypothetical protein
MRPQADDPGPQWQVAECLLPGLTLAAAGAMTQRVREELARSADPVSFLGSLLMPGDEVLLCLFAGPAAEVRAVSERAGLPFERILACVGLGWRVEDSRPPNEPGPAARSPQDSPAARDRDMT